MSYHGLDRKQLKDLFKRKYANLLLINGHGYDPKRTDEFSTGDVLDGWSEETMRESIEVVDEYTRKALYQMQMYLEDRAEVETPLKKTSKTKVSLVDHKRNAKFIFWFTLILSLLFTAIV